MAVLLALVSALAYGISDFLGGVLSARSTAWLTATVGQASATLSALVLVPFLSGTPSAGDLGWAVVAGLGSGLGAAFLYRGLSTASMSVVAPISAVGSALIPVAVGLLLGERPGTRALIGIVLAFPAIALIAWVRDPDPAHHGGVLDGLLAGTGFGILFVALGQIRDDAGGWPVVVMYLASTLAVIAVAAASGQRWRPRGRADLGAVVLGPIGLLAVVAFYLATAHGLLSVVSVIAALYPASTVLLAAVVLHERVTRSQAAGLALAVAAVSLVASG